MSFELEQIFELGKLYAEKGDFTLAEKSVSIASEGFYSQKKFSEYLDCVRILLRIYSEREQFDMIAQTKEKLQDLVLKEGFTLSSKIFYTLANCSSQKNQYTLALEYSQKALALGLANDNKEDICYAIFSLASVYSMMSPPRYEDALKELYNLQVFFEFLDLPELKIAAQLRNAMVLQKLKKYDQSLELCWKAYDDFKVVKSFYLKSCLLYQFAQLYTEMGDKDLALLYLNLVRRTIDPKNFVRLNRMVTTLSETLGGFNDTTYDLFFDEETHTITEKKIGKVDFKNQFILLDLLRLFLQNHGVVYSKEFLVEKVWKQPYDPSIHDNKIYVTIKRLRRLIEPDFEKPKYIFRAKNGYYMNKSARVHIEQKH